MFFCLFSFVCLGGGGGCSLGNMGSFVYPPGLPACLDVKRVWRCCSCYVKEGETSTGFCTDSRQCIKNTWKEVGEVGVWSFLNRWLDFHINPEPLNTILGHNTRHREHLILCPGQNWPIALYIVLYMTRFVY